VLDHSLEGVARCVCTSWCNAAWTLSHPAASPPPRYYRTHCASVEYRPFAAYLRHPHAHTPLLLALYLSWPRHPPTSTTSFCSHNDCSRLLPFPPSAATLLPHAPPNLRGFYPRISHCQLVSSPIAGQPAATLHHYYGAYPTSRTSWRFEKGRTMAAGGVTRLRLPRPCVTRVFHKRRFYAPSRCAAAALHRPTCPDVYLPPSLVLWLYRGYGRLPRAVSVLRFSPAEHWTRRA